MYFLSLQRRLPWQSTAQVSATLALVNPVIWYLIDRTKTGFFLSTIVGLGGMCVILGLEPEVVAAPPDSSSTATSRNNTGGYALMNGLTQEGIAVRVWVASVLFCACVCFGNVGRQLALGGVPKEASKARMAL